MLVIALITGLMIGNGFSLLYKLEPEPQGKPPRPPYWGPPLRQKTIQVGFIAPTTQSLEYLVPLTELIEEDLNQYFDLLRYNLRFELLVDNADGQAEVHLEKVQNFKYMAVSIIIGGFWDADIGSNLPYCNDNDILLISPTSRSTKYAIADDSLYRLSSPVTYQYEVITDMLKEKGIGSVVLVGDSGSSASMESFESILIVEGIALLDRIQFPEEKFDDETLDRIEAAVGPMDASEKIGLLYLSEDPLLFCLNKASNHPRLLNASWIYDDEANNLDTIIGYLPQDSAEIDLTIITVAPLYSDKYNALAKRLEEKQVKLDYSLTCTYDAAFITALSILEAQTIYALNVKTLFPDVADGFFGVSGWTRLDDNGDRLYSDYNIWGIDYGNETTLNLVGKYEGIGNKFTWLKEDTR